MAYYTVGTPYMDDNVKGKNSPFYLGITFSLRIIGPTLGFLLSSFCLKYYEDPMMNPGFDNSDPKWVGAWWIGFLVLGLAIFLVSFPLALFPKHLAVHDEMTTEEEINISKNSFYELLPALKKLMKNPILMFHTMSITFQINGLFGYLVFMPKYIESQYRKTASSASFFSGNVTLAAMVIGVFLSGFCIHKLKPKARSLVGYMLFVELCAAVALLSAFFTGCESPSLQEHTASLLSVEPKACNSNCTCDSHIFSPICDVNNQMHFSPCSAGCYSSSKSGNGKMIFHNCSCILPSDEDLKYSALKGFCPQECSMFVAYIAIITVAKMLSATVRVGNVLINLRCVDEQDKTLALGAVEVVISVFATIPFPLFYGYIINKACILWDKSCEYQGNCWLYDNTLFRNYLHSVAVGFMFLAICCDSVVFVMSPRMRDLYGENKKPAANIELTATDS
ncbi:hypothetical protein JTE90_000260 [Oedothorax gibbosus]|uniref:Solute carrier organic anion transporter family member n=1 Tax=Oedothorax gibbosus TaxID=931172 RepID=A0AAV6VV94_9ARAC|nr:hypothetical protein JTE90_000260 [Oedothorax gibbosus]